MVERRLSARGLTAVVTASAAATALVLAALYTAESFITATAGAQAMGLAVVVTAAVALGLQAVAGRRAAGRRRRAASGDDSLVR